MASSGYASQQWLNTVLSGATRYLALFTTAPNDSDGSAVEVSGGAYARVQIAGTVATSAATSASTTLTFASVPAWITVGMTVRDLTNTGAIASGVTVASKTSTTVVLSTSVTVSSGDNISFSAFGAGTGAGPATATSTATITFPQATASWGTVVAWGIYDASTAGNLWEWDWLGNDPWFPCTVTSASPGVVTAIGITAGSSPTLANGANVVFTSRYGGNVATGLSAETPYTVAGLSADTFNVGTNTSSTGAAMVRQITEQPIPANVTATFASGGFVLSAA